MKPERILLTIVAVLLVAGWIAWATSNEPGLPVLSLWLWLGAFGVSMLPLLALLLTALFDRGRKNDS